jgi:amino acid adenylation domain-containing protein
VGPEVRVALCLERSPDLLSAILGVMLAGGAYVPLDPASPRERLAFLLEDSAPAVLLTSGALLAALPAMAAPVLLLEAALSATAPTAPETASPAWPAGSLAYVIYTSGSTGRPKGTLVSHSALAAFARGLRSAVAELNGGGPLRLSLNASFAFDAALQQIVQLAAGHALWIVPEEARRDGDRMAAFLRDAGLDGFDCTPSQLELLLGAMDVSGRPPRFVLAGGEAIPPALWDRLALHPRTRFYNVYGPTECTVDATARLIARQDSGQPSRPDIGRPIAGYRLHVLDAGGLPVPAGFRGEIRIGGPALARGYWRRPDLTADRFRPDPFGGEPGGRLYRTGDLGRWLHDGRIELLGRADGQIKLRGLRIEPGEIEAALAAHPAVAEAAVGVREGAAEERRLIAWVVLSELPEPPEPRALRRWLAERLPEAMVPAAVVVLGTLPRTASGKLDRRALPDPSPDPSPDPPRDRILPGETAEETADGPFLPLLELFREVLGVAGASIHDNFFDLGGHSLAAYRLATRIHEVLGFRLPVREIFAASTVAELARRLEAGSEGLVVALQPRGVRAPFFCVHPGGGDVTVYRAFALSLDSGHPFLALRAPGLEEGEEPLRDIGALAERHLRELRRARPEGPWHLGGWSSGAVVAFEMARRLRAAGGEVAALVLLDPPDLPFTAADPDDVEILAAPQAAGLPLEGPDLERRLRVFRAGLEALRAYEPGSWDGPLTLLEAAARPAPATFWRNLATTVATVPGDHVTILQPPQVDELARRVREALG